MAGTNLMAAASLAPKILGSLQLVDTSDHAVYVVPGSSSAIVKHAVACNVTASPVSFTLSIVPSGQSADATRQVISGFSLLANDSLPLDNLLAGAHLTAGDAIHATASVGAAVNVTITGIEVS